jgi:hypothetical protein
MRQIVCCFVPRSAQPNANMAEGGAPPEGITIKSYPVPYKDIGLECDKMTPGWERGFPELGRGFQATFRGHSLVLSYRSAIAVKKQEEGTTLT